MTHRSHPSASICRFVGRDRAGAIAVEFALLAPLLLLLLFGTLRVGHAIGVQHALSQLAASAARQALPGASADERRTVVESFVLENAETFALLTASRLALDVSETAQSLTVLVSMDVSHIPDIPVVSAAFRFPERQSATAVIAVQH